MQQNLPEADALNSDCLYFERQHIIRKSYKETQNRYRCLAGDIKIYIRDVFRTFQNIYDRAFLKKYVMAKNSWLFWQKAPLKRVLIMYLHMFPKNVCDEPIVLFMTFSTPWGWIFTIWKIFTFFIHVIIQK